MMLFTATGLAAYILARHRLAFIFVSLLCTVAGPPLHASLADRRTAADREPALGVKGHVEARRRRLRE
jgi:hypothetical protein